MGDTLKDLFNKKSSEKNIEKESNTKYCSNCGKKVSKDDRYCSNCGNKLSK